MRRNTFSEHAGLKRHPTGYSWVSSHLLPVSGCLVELRLSSENLYVFQWTWWVAGIGDALLRCSFMTRQRGSETGSRYFRARLTEDREEEGLYMRCG